MVTPLKYTYTKISIYRSCISFFIRYLVGCRVHLQLHMYSNVVVEAVENCGYRERSGERQGGHSKTLLLHLGHEHAYGNAQLETIPTSHQTRNPKVDWVINYSIESYVIK